MTHGSLFSGIGGFDLAAQWAGWDNVFQVEINDWCQKILTKNFPNVKRYGDIKQFNGNEWRGKVDVISGGFPCQPYSMAGKRLGKDDERHLWPEMLRVIREVAPTWVVGENVRGLVSWSEGLVFEEVCADLEAAGYEVQPFVLPAASVGAPHIRQRVWFVAHAKKSNDRRNAQDGRPQRNNVSEFGGTSEVSAADTCCEQRKVWRDVDGNREDETKGGARIYDRTARFSENGNDSDSDNERRKEQHITGEPSRPGRLGRYDASQWDEWTTESPVCGMDDGIPRRMDRIAGLGNAVVPQLVFQIFDTINQYEANQ